MPHLGHLPALSLTTSGCIEQVYCLAWFESDLAQPATLKTRANNKAKVLNSAFVIRGFTVLRGYLGIP